MNKNTYKILKYINNGNVPKPYGKILSKFKRHCIPSVSESIFMLKTDKMIDIACCDVDGNNNPINPSIISITSKGKEYIETQMLQKLRFWLPTTISIIAIIGAYRREILWLIQELVQLLK